MSGSDSITAAMTAATTTALMRLDSIVRSFPLDFVKDFLYCADRRRQGLPYLVGQSHARANVGRLARDDEAAARAAAHRGEHREDLVGRQAVRVHDSVWCWHVVGLDLEHRDGARRAATLRGVDQDEQVTPVEQLVHQVHAPDTEVGDLPACRTRPAGKQAYPLDAEGVVPLEDVAHPRDQRPACHG